MRASAPKRCSYPPELDANARGLTVAVSNSASEVDPEGDPNSIAAGQSLESGAAVGLRVMLDGRMSVDP